MTDYHDDDGNPVSLDQLCRNEPRWAATQIARLREQVAGLERERDEARAELDSWKNNTRNALTVAIDERDALRAEAGRLRERVAGLEREIGEAELKRWNWEQRAIKLERERDEIARLRARVEELEGEVERWKLASGLERGGDPGTSV